MKGSFYRRGCTCKKKRCTCGAKWAFTIDIGRDPKTGKRRQRKRSGFRTRDKAVRVANELLYEINQGTFVEEKNTLYNIVKGINRTGRMIFKKAIELEVIKRDPTEFTSIKKPMKTIEELEENQIPKYMEKEELYLFLETAKKQGLEMDYLAFLILSYTGMRIGELVCLKWNDINFKEDSIRIIKTYYNEKNNTVKYQLVLPKTKGSIRTIVVEDEIIEELKKHKTAQKKAIKRLGDAYYNEGFIFANTERRPGYPMLIKTVANRMKRLLKTAGLNQELTPHSFRHTHTSLLAEAGVGLEEIMDRLGHTEDETTRLIYLHVTEELKREASQKFGQLMRSLQ